MFFKIAARSLINILSIANFVNHLHGAGTKDLRKKLMSVVSFTFLVFSFLRLVLFTTLVE